VYLGAGRWMRLLQDSLFQEVLASKGVKVRGLLGGGAAAD
jgi:hypothetical protein